MRENEKIAHLFALLQQGDCWVGLNMQQALKGIDAGKASAAICENGNSIWQLVNHLVYWRKTVLNRLQGKLALPAMPDMYLPEDLSADSWQTTLQHFEEVYRQLYQAILDFDERQLDQDSPRKGQTYFELLTGCLQHDAYHMGQIVLLKKNS